MSNSTQSTMYYTHQDRSLTCAYCNTHLPHDEATTTKAGTYHPTCFEQVFTNRPDPKSPTQVREERATKLHNQATVLNEVCRKAHDAYRQANANAQVANDLYTSHVQGHEPF